MPNIVVSAKCIRPDGTPVLALKSLVSGLVNDVAILRLRLYNSSINEIRLMIRQSTNAGQRRFHVNMTMIRGPWTKLSHNILPVVIAALLRTPPAPYSSIHNFRGCTILLVDANRREVLHYDVGYESPDNLPGLQRNRVRDNASDETSENISSSSSSDAVSSAGTQVTDVSGAGSLFSETEYIRRTREQTETQNLLPKIIEREGRLYNEFEIELPRINTIHRINIRRLLHDTCQSRAIAWTDPSDQSTLLFEYTPHGTT
jgi:hypothetical protein